MVTRVTASEDSEFNPAKLVLCPDRSTRPDSLGAQTVQLGHTRSKSDRGRSDSLRLSRPPTPGARFRALRLGHERCCSESSGGRPSPSAEGRRRMPSGSSGQDTSSGKGRRCRQANNRGGRLSRKNGGFRLLRQTGTEDTVLRTATMATEERSSRRPARCAQTVGREGGCAFFAWRSGGGGSRRTVTTVAWRAALDEGRAPDGRHHWLSNGRCHIDGTRGGIPTANG